MDFECKYDLNVIIYFTVNYSKAFDSDFILLAFVRFLIKKNNPQYKVFYVLFFNVSNYVHYKNYKAC